MKKNLCCILCILVMTGCSNNKTEESIIEQRTSLHTVSDIMTGDAEDSVAIKESEYTIAKTSTIEYETETTDQTEYFDYGNFTVEDIESPWTEEDINTAISMSIFNEPYSDYNRRFIDFSSDGIPELVMSWRNNFGLLFVFEKVGDEIARIPFNADYDTLTPHAVFGVPPVYKEDMDVYSLSSDNEFIIATDSDGNFYISGFSHSANKDTCFVKQIFYENDEIRIKTIYRWGEFRWYNSSETEDYEYVLGYIKYLNGDSVIAGNETGTHINRFDLAEYTEVTPEEIEDFLKRLYGDDFSY